jgi:hypothetical protein
MYSWPAKYTVPPNRMPPLDLSPNPKPAIACGSKVVPGVGRGFEMRGYCGR